MKKILSVAAFMLVLGISSSAMAEQKMWLVTSLMDAASGRGAGLRTEVGSLLVDVHPNFVRSGSTNTMPLYIDAYMGLWGVAFNSTDLLGSGTNNLQLQFAAEQWINEKIGVGAACNVVDYTINSGAIGILTGLNSYIIVAI